MPGGKLESLSSIFGTVVKKASKKSGSSSSAAAATPKLKTSKTTARNCRKRISATPVSSSKEVPRVSSKSASALSSGSRESSSKTVDPEVSPKQILKEVSSMLCGRNTLESLSSSASHKPDDGKSPDIALAIPWLSNTSQISMSLRRKEVSRERRQKWIFKNTQTNRFERLVKMCAEKLGTKATLEVFGKLGRETGTKEYNSLMKLCIENARHVNDADISLDHIHKAFQLLRLMKEQGFPVEEESYRPFLMYFIDMEMVDEFYFFYSLIQDESQHSFERLGYYEMLLWIRVNNEDKVQELCSSVVDISEDRLDLAVSYLVALCDTDKEKELVRLLEVIDITKISLEHMTAIFKSLGRLLLENVAEKCILALKLSETQEKDISSLIYNYVISMPNLEVEEVLSKFKDLHKKLEVLPSSTSYDKLIINYCDSLQVHAALDAVDQMYQLGLTLSIETFQRILRASEQSFELDLVHPIYSIMRHYNVKPNVETFKSMINLCVKMKDFEGAFNMLRDAEEMNEGAAASMYNAIMVGYFREKDIYGALKVLRQMESANVKPDSETFSYLIGNSECEEDIMKYQDQMQCAGVKVTKYVYMSLIHAYANCGQFGKAKQVILDRGIPVKYINEIKSVLVQALASNGQILDALVVYKEIKQAGSCLEAKAVINLIENLQSEGEIDKLLQLLSELNDPNSWLDGCSRVILYCVRHKLLSSAVELLKQLKGKDEAATYSVFDQMFCQIWETQPTDLEIGLGLLRAIREELHLHPSRTSLDFLLCACVSAKDPGSAELIWKEYGKADLPFNVLTYLRKYQVLLASGNQVSAAKLLRKIPKDDPHVRRIIKESEATFCGTKSTE